MKADRAIMITVYSGAAPVELTLGLMLMLGIEEVVGVELNAGLEGCWVGVDPGIDVAAASYSVYRTSVTALTARFKDCPHRLTKVGLLQS